MARDAGIRSTGTCAGEVSVSVRELAERCGTSEAAIRRSLGDRSVRISRQPPLHLALSAANECLRRAGAAVEEIDAILWFGDQPSGLHLQHELGAVGAFTLFLDGYCSEMVPALRVGRDLVRDGARRVLVVSEDRYELPYTAQAPSERGYADLTSDGGAAVLLEADASLELAAFGFATRASQWDFWDRYHAFHAGRLTAEALPEPISVAHDEIAVRRDALRRCLDTAGLSTDGIDHFILAERIRAPMLSLARQLGIAADRVVAPQFGHMGRCDVVFDLEQLLASPPPARVQTILMMAATVGVCRCAVLRRSV